MLVPDGQGQDELALQRAEDSLLFGDLQELFDNVLQLPVPGLAGAQQVGDGVGISLAVGGPTGKRNTSRGDGAIHVICRAKFAWQSKRMGGA